MMHGYEKSDHAVVAVKLANKAERSAAELVEPGAGTEGNAHQQSTHWTQSQGGVSRALERIRQFACRLDPRWEPYAGKPHVRIWAGGARQLASLPRRISSGRYCKHCGRIDGRPDGLDRAFMTRSGALG
jgi:hypothetical protein